LASSHQSLGAGAVDRGRSGRTLGVAGNPWWLKCDRGVGRGVGPSGRRCVGEGTVAGMSELEEQRTPGSDGRLASSMG